MANINKNEIGYNENTTANALMVQYKRGLAAPMDISEVFTSLTSAQQYAKKDPIAYAGQTIAVAGEGIKTEVYKITSGGTLVRLVDENDIKNLSGATKNEVPIVKGDAENSAVLKGGDNQVLSEGGVALGKDNLVGLKGWYYSSIYKENDNTISVYLSNEQKVLTESSEALKTSSQKADDSLPNLLDILGEGTLVSLVNDSKYDDKFKIIGGSNGVVRLQTVDESDLPFSVIKGEIIIEPEDYSIYCLSMPDKGLFDMGQGSSAFGYNNKVTNGKATAFGYNNHAYGKYSFVEGRDNKAGYGAHAEGRDNVASGYLSHVEGGYTLAEGAESHAEGWHTTAKGAHSHTEGTETTAEGNDSHAEGANTKTVGRASHAEGIRGTANGNYSHVEGSDSISTGVASHAEGYKTHAKGNYTHSEGQETSAEGKWSHAEGFKSQSKGEYSHAEGNDTKSEGINSHAEGYKSYSLGPHSHAEGNETKTEGSCAHAEGYKTQAMGKYSHAEGNNTISKNEAEHACGKYNLSNSDTRFSIGIGTSDSDRKNAFEVKQNGDIYIEGVEGKIQDKLNEISNINKTIEDNEEVTSAALNELNTDIKQLYKAVNDKASEISNINQIIEENERVCADSISELNNRINNINTKTVLASTNEKCYLIGYSSKEGNTQTLNTSSTDVYMENGELFAVSDETLKDFGSDIDIDLNKLAELPKVYYSLKNDADKKQMIGTSAQKLREIYPELVSEDANGKLAVSYEKLSIVALAAIDKLNKKHEEKLAQLESELDKIKKELNII